VLTRSPVPSRADTQNMPARRSRARRAPTQAGCRRYPRPSNPTVIIARSRGAEPSPHAIVAGNMRLLTFFVASLRDDSA
jgi:hypothetical protein